MKPPATRGECAALPRPCRRDCRYRLPTRGDEESCALDVAELGPQTLERVGELLRIGESRVRQLEARAFARIRDGAFGEKMQAQLREIDSIA